MENEIKANHLYMIVGNSNGHEFENGSLVVRSIELEIKTYGMIIEYKCYNDHDWWWVIAEDVVLIGEV